MAYTTIDDPSAYFNSLIYTGNVTVRALTFDGNSDLAVDWIWLKSRSISGNHHLYDSVRGTQKHLRSNLDSAEGTNGGTDGVTAFSSNGVTIGTNTASNDDGETFVGWGWKAGTSFTNDASSTSIGSIDSAGSVSDVSGFSIVSFTGTGSNGTIKHGLSTAPDLFIIKRRDSANDWRVGSSALTNFVKHVNLNTTAAESDLAAAFNSTGPTTSVFSVGTSVSTNASGGTYIAYCFSSIKGYSKVGSYTGNNSVTDGTFVYTGFKPAFVMVKLIDSQTDNWIMQDNKINSFNGASSQRLRPNSSGAEFTSTNEIDFLSNGFKCRGDDGEFNGDGFSYIYMAFAESPFVTSTEVPATAR